jgi:hypothetical protein
VIISHEHQFIFIKTRKTAGTSIEIALSKHCGPHDVITPVLPEDEEIRRVYGGRPPQNFVRGFGQYRLKDWARLLLKFRRAPDYRNHIPGPAVRSSLPARVWNSYFKFCVERNPWDKVISGYYWISSLRKREGRPVPTLTEFIHGELIYDYKDWRRYAVGDRIIVDRVLRFEDLSNELAGVAQTLNLPSLELPRAKGGHRSDKRPYWEVLSESDRLRIAQVFADEIKLFGYEFQPESSSARAI